MELHSPTWDDRLALVARDHSEDIWRRTTIWNTSIYRARIPRRGNLTRISVNKEIGGGWYRRDR